MENDLLGKREQPLEREPLLERSILRFRAATENYERAKAETKRILEQTAIAPG
jgi:hypothetical protein